MKLSIIIPHYNEAENLIKHLLSSIENQVGVNFNELEVIIVNDGNPKTLLSDKFLKMFSRLNITYLKEQTNGGSSVARNIGLRNAKGEYVMFCDADDRFLTCTALFTVLNEIAKDEQSGKPQDMYIYDFLEEFFKDNRMFYLTHNADFIFLHGKVYSRKFLSYNNIFFCDELKVNEDSYFNGLCRSNSNAIRIVNLPIFIWCYNPNSLSRQPDFRFNCFITLFNTATKLVEKLLETKNKHAPYYVTQFAYHIFWQLQTVDWKAREAERENIEKTFEKYWAKYEELYNQVNAEETKQIYTQERNKVLPLLGGIEQETFGQFVDRIKNKKN